MTTHCSESWLMARSVWIEGSATFTIATSRTTMNCAAHSRTRINPVFGGVMVAVVMPPPHRSEVCSPATSCSCLAYFHRLSFGIDTGLRRNRAAIDRPVLGRGGVSTGEDESDEEAPMTTALLEK